MTNSDSFIVIQSIHHKRIAEQTYKHKKNHNKTELDLKNLSINHWMMDKKN